MKSIFVFISFISTISISNSQIIYPKAEETSIGVIVDGKNEIYGTGFVLTNHRCVVTCSHVLEAIKGNAYYIPYNSELKFPIVLPIKRKKDDLALCVLGEKINTTPFEFDTSYKISLLDTIYYFGYDQTIKTEKFFEVGGNVSLIVAYGKYYNGGVIADFFEFEGTGIPGYSGSPVFNKNGKVIGVLANAFFSQGLHRDSPVILLNRGVSIKPVSKNIKK